MRQSLQDLICRAGWRARLFASAEAFLSEPPPQVTNCLILDVRLPDLCGLELQHRVRDRVGTAVIFVTSHADISTTVTAMKRGAVEFLTKPCSSEVLLGAIRRALALSHLVLRREAELHQLRERRATLSRRETEVMTLVVSGLLNKQVGCELGISETTVKAHRGKVMQKMRAGSLPALVNMAADLAHPLSGELR